MLMAVHPGFSTVLFDADLIGPVSSKCKNSLITNQTSTMTTKRKTTIATPPRKNPLDEINSQNIQSRKNKKLQRKSQKIEAK